MIIKTNVNHLKFVNETEDIFATVFCICKGILWVSDFLSI